MAEPRIQYCTTADGVNLAFCIEGTGLPLMHLGAMWGGQLASDPLLPGIGESLEFLRSHFQVIRYDSRGRGLSDRDVTDWSLEAHTQDLLTVLDRAGIERVPVCARAGGGPVALTFAHRYPERVSHLVLVGTAARVADFFDNPRGRAITALLANDWELYTEVISRLMFGWSEHELAGRFAAQMRASSAPESRLSMRAETRSWDVSDLLAGISAPTLVLHTRGEPVLRSGDGQSRQLAAGIPGAQLRMIELIGEESAHAIYEFVTGETLAPPPEPASLPEGMAVMLFADIVDSTALTEQLGDAAFRARASRLDGSMRSAIRECGGTPIEGKVMGDGVMGVFNSARQAIEGAFRCEAATDGTGLALHLGIHAGDVLREGNNVFGGAVNIASRISGLCEPGEVLVSDIVRGLARTSSGVGFEDRGEHQLKGIADAVRVYAVRQGSV